MALVLARAPDLDALSADSAETAREMDVRTLDPSGSMLEDSAVTHLDDGDV